MEFNTLFFIFIYLPLFVGVMYYVKNNKTRNIIILIFSLLFYYCGCKEYFVLLILISLITYLFAKKVKQNKLIYIIYLVIILSTLAVFKYHKVIADVFMRIGNGAVFSDLIMPLGISFYTFTSISYVSDVFYDRYEYENNYLKILSYLSFFPVVISGPLIRIVSSNCGINSNF